MPSVTEFIVDQATVRFGPEDDPFEVVYRPGMVYIDRTDIFMEAIGRNDVLATIYLLAGYGENDALVVSWNLTGPLMGHRKKMDENGEQMEDERGRPVFEEYEAVKDGEIVPIDPDVLRFMNANTLVGIYGKIQEDYQKLSASFFTKTTTPSLNGSRKRS